ncbi:MAG: type II toxin-antitoxin system RelE/ParE family toxin [Rhodobacteraceae bacterium]|nr:type II toxin-antitoxin system RelE/ParE family toxin [Paracoccaceae bacterium]
MAGEPCAPFGEQNCNRLHLELIDGIIFCTIMDEYAIRSHVTKQGRAPFDDWYNGLDAQSARMLYEALTRMEEGNPGDTKPVGKGVMERRIHHRPGYRIYFGLDGRKIVVLLTGGTKKRQ